MLQTTNKTPQGLSTLRCVWMPTHLDANAPLIAVWIETTSFDSIREKDQGLSKDQEVIFDEPDLWHCAA